MPMPIKTTPAITVVFLGVKVRILELPILNRQLIRVNYDTLGDLVKDLISGKITYVTEDQQIEIMKTHLHTNCQITGLSGYFS